ncbi:MAG: LysR family transcriptional regulator [Oleispira antarctica]|uniref:Substrate-binding transcriptional regulator, LysR family n=1 Tax=Oleispira antarctica RB-8 TaxID=698738 RepID=R4YNR0_OLEAN|nr:LysR family transcriptional regulator [Oleispira antarctica]MBQ0793786.1 LysR family transcriptional regulator [Oleispira antarctica]CCK74793.1 Substrate-binding transcriptional regulator, LysR family [Oleispira antarctica RB-8]
MSQLDDLKAFVIIAKHGSFTKAAEILGCSRSHLSKQLNLLETQLGVSLITRTTRAQRLTEQGQLLFNQCQLAFNTLDTAVQMTMEQAHQLKGNININCVGGYLGEDIIAKLIARFIQKYPDIRVNLDFSSERVDLLSGQFDVVFRMGKLPDSGLIARKLMTITNGLFASPNYLKKYGSPAMPDELIRHQCITGSINHWLFQHGKKANVSQEVVVSGAIRCKNGRVIKNMAIANNGIARLPFYYCQEELKAQQLVSVFEDWKLADTPLYLIYHKDHFQAQRLKVFVDFIVTEFSRGVMAQ